MTCCEKLFVNAVEHRKHLDAPVKIYPGCHPKAHVEVYVDSTRGSVILCCSRCGDVLEEVKSTWLKYGNITKSNKRPKVKGKSSKRLGRRR